MGANGGTLRMRAESVRPASVAGLLKAFPVARVRRS